MKKIIILLAVFTLLVAGIAYAGVLGSKHDLSLTKAGTYMGSSDEVCIYCHVPHMARAAGTYAPLWNKSEYTFTTQGSYGSPTFNGTTGGADPDASRITPLCMSCHDGVKAPAEHYEGSTLTDDTATKITVGLFVGATTPLDLTRNHPVDFVMGTDAGIDQTEITATGTYPLFKGDTFTCSTCHDVHNGTNNNMLRGSATLSQSAFCLECHIK